MSIQAINHALTISVGKSTDKLVFFCLANHADEYGVCYPSNAALVGETELNRKTIIASLQSLVAGGFIQDTGHRKGATKQIIVYQIDFTVKCRQNNPKNGTVKESQKRNSPKNGTVPNLDIKSPKNGHKESQKRDTEPSGTIKEPSVGGACAPEPPPPSGKKVSQDRGTRLPEDWKLSMEVGKWAEGKGLMPAEVLEQRDFFKDYWHARAGPEAKKCDWDATFKNWIRRYLRDKNDGIQRRNRY